MKLQIIPFTLFMVLAGWICTPVAVFGQTKKLQAPASTVEYNAIEHLTFVPVAETGINQAILVIKNPDFIMEFSTQRSGKPVAGMFDGDHSPSGAKRKTFFSRYKYWMIGGAALLVSASVLTFRKNTSPGHTISQPPGRPF